MRKRPIRPRRGSSCWIRARTLDSKYTSRWAPASSIRCPSLLRVRAVSIFSIKSCRNWAVSLPNSQCSTISRTAMVQRLSKRRRCFLIRTSRECKHKKWTSITIRLLLWCTMARQRLEVSLATSRRATTPRPLSTYSHNNSHRERTVKCRKKSRQRARPKKSSGTTPPFNSNNSNRVCSCLRTRRRTRRWHWTTGDKPRRRIRTSRMISVCSWAETSTICRRACFLAIRWPIQVTRSSPAEAPRNQKAMAARWRRASFLRTSNYLKQVI